MCRTCVQGEHNIICKIGSINKILIKKILRWKKRKRKTTKLNNKTFYD